ncbi:unnamed protein product [Diatraea saccharalis]|uniref:CCHC-type domain-containing protein n=1 Tax=Diatraea saccharalis TaxID=40085 RepID=A0A9N9REK8_9NEOP|nr:unnamed protein product [Diatraea saccharalis]
MRKTLARVKTLNSDVKSKSQSTYARVTATNSVKPANKSPFSERRSAITLNTSSPRAFIGSHPALVVTPIDKDSNRDANTAELKRILKEASVPNPNHFRLIFKGKIRLQFNSIEEQEKAADHLKATATDKFIVEPERKDHPRIILKGIYKDTPSDQLVHEINDRNPELNITNEKDLQLRFTSSNSNQSLYNAILVVTPTLWQKLSLIQPARFKIGFQKVHYEEFPAFKHCRKCAQFGYTQGQCKSNQICTHCGLSDHIRKECPTANKTPSCIVGHSTRYQNLKISWMKNTTRSIIPALDSSLCGTESNPKWIMAISN